MDSIEYLQRVRHSNRERLPFWTLGSVFFWDMHMLHLFRPVLSNLQWLFPTLNLEYPFMLSRFCFHYICNCQINTVIVYIRFVLLYCLWLNPPPPKNSLYMYLRWWIIVFMEHLRRVWHASRERLPLRTLDSVPFWGMLMLQLLRPIFPVLIVSFLDLSPWISLGTLSILLIKATTSFHGMYVYV